MGREPGLRQRSAFAGIDVIASACVFVIIVDGVFMVECVVLVERFVRPRAVGVDDQRLLSTVSEQGSNRRFVGGFRWHHRAVIGGAISE